MKKIQFYLLWILSALFLLGSCSDDHTGLVPGGNGAQLSLWLDLPAPAQPGTRSEVGISDENRITSITLLLFKQGECFKTVAGTLTSSATGTNGNRQAFTASLPESGSYEVVAVANVSLDASGVIGKTKSEVRELLKVSQTGKWDLTAKAIPMWGEFVNFDPAESNQTVKMTRMLARVNVDATAVSGIFQLTGINIRNYNQTGMLIPLPGNFSDNKASAPSLPDTPDRGTTSLSYSPINNNMSQNQIYLFEAETKGEYSPEDGGPVVTGDWEDNICIILKGKYAGDAQETYYRMDFISKEWEWLDVLRNHTYDFRITHVFGPGYDDEDEAFNSIATNIEGDVIVWNDNDTGEIWVDGLCSLQVDPVDMQCYSRGVEEDDYTGSSKVLKESLRTYFTVNCDFDNWTIDINKNSFNADDAWYDNLKWFYRTYGDTYASWKEFDMNAGLQAGKYEMYAVCGENTLYNEPITGNFTIRAGRVAIPVTFTQTSSIYLGKWGGELVKSKDSEGNDQYSFAKKLYIREDDDARKVKFSENNTGTHKTDSHLGKENTYGLVQNTDIGAIAAKICFDSNKAAISGVDDDKFVWFLPSLKQGVIMMVTRAAVLAAAKDKKADNYYDYTVESPLSYYYYRTSNIASGNLAFIAGVGSKYSADISTTDYGATYGGSKAIYTVRCVREVD